MAPAAAVEAEVQAMRIEDGGGGGGGGGRRRPLGRDADGCGWEDKDRVWLK